MWMGTRIVTDGLAWRADWRLSIDIDAEPIRLTAVCGLANRENPYDTSDCVTIDTGVRERIESGPGCLRQPGPAKQRPVTSHSPGSIAHE